MSTVRAVILAAGLGTRLRPLTDRTPKCLLPVAGRPLLDYWLDALAAAGVREVLVNTHALAQQVRAHIQTIMQRGGMRLKEAYEPELLGSAATLRRGSFAAYGGSDAYGIYNTGSSTTLEATNVTVLGESGSGFNYGLYNSTVATANIIQSVLEGASYSVYRSSGSVTVSHSRLVGSGVSGTVTCVLVTRGSSVSTDGSTCP